MKKINYNILFIFLSLFCCYCISLAFPDSELIQLELKNNKRLVRNDISLKKHFSEEQNIFIISEWMPMGYYREFKPIFYTSYDRYKNFYPITNYIEKDSCLDSDKKSVLLSDLLNCRPLSLIYLKKKNYENLKANYPALKFEIIDSSRVNYLLRKKTLD